MKLLLPFTFLTAGAALLASGTLSLLHASPGISGATSEFSSFATVALFLGGATLLTFGVGALTSRLQTRWV